MPWPTSKRGNIIGTPHAGTHTLGNWQSDDAVDISVPVGTAMVAVEDGVVTKVTRHPQNGGRFAGDQITIKGASNSYFYAHGTAAVSVGQQVKAGQMIGRSGSANGVPHLHFGVQTGDPRTILSKAASGGSSLLDRALQAGKGALGATPAAPLVAGDVIPDAARDAATDAATAGAKAGFNLVWDAIGDEASKATLYVLLVAGGIFLVVIGVSRAAGVKPSSAAKAAVTVIPQARAARAVAGAGAARGAVGAVA